MNLDDFLADWRSLWATGPFGVPHPTRKNTLVGSVDASAEPCRGLADGTVVPTSSTKTKGRWEA